MNRFIEAKDIPVPREVLVHARDGREFRALITGNSLDNSAKGYQLCATGIDASSRQPISLAPTTWVELGRDIVTE